MSNPIVDLRDIVYLRIALDKANSVFSFNDFTLAKSYYPHLDLEKLATDHPAGRLYVMASAADSESISRSNAALKTCRVILGYQKKVNPDDPDTIDPLVHFLEELELLLRERVEAQNGAYSWKRTEYFKDKDNAELPYHFCHLREISTFETFLYGFYSFVVEPSS